MTKIVEEVRQSIEKFSMLKKGAKVLLCVSGGPDSVAMLLIFDSLRRDMDLKLFIAHLNHKLRGRESDEDQEYVRRLTTKLKLPLIIACEDVNALARSKKLSIEDAARMARYDFFLKAARHLGVDSIATAHTMDDQAETVLMRIMRGAGLRGLKGISPVRRISAFLLIRPLIYTSRKDIESYLKSNRIKPRLDTSNLKGLFLRNRIRLNLMPLLEKEYSPRIKKIISNIAELLDKDYEYLTLIQEEIFKKIAKSKEDSVKFSISDFKRQHISMQRALIRKSIEFLSDGLENIDYRHWLEVEDLIYKRPLGSIVHLPAGVEAVKTMGTLKLRRALKEKPKKHKLAPVILEVPGTTSFGRKRIMAQILKRPASVINHTKQEEYFDMAGIRLPLILRLRCAGDRMIPLGMKDYKKIKDIFIDEKIPLRQRDKIAVVVSSNGEIAWLAGIKMSDRFKVLPATKEVLKLKLL